MNLGPASEPAPAPAPCSTDPADAGWRWPRRCLLCRRWSGEALCGGCTRRFAAPRPRCRRCGLALAPSVPDPPGQAMCAACRADPPAFDLAVAAADYGFPWDRLISRFKFEQSPELARPLSELLVQAVAAQLAAAGWPTPALVVPVPLAPRRLAERGYNQAWLLARSLAARLGLPASPMLLERWRDTPHQVGASRAERLRNLTDAFLVDPRQHGAVRGRPIALVDDVLTTGVTAQAATRALRQAGAASVQVWVIARTPPPDDGAAATIA